MDIVENSLLDFGVNKVVKSNDEPKLGDMILNPFFGPNNLDSYGKTLYVTFKTLYILCLDNKVEKCDNMFHQQHFSKERFEKSWKEYVLIKGNMKMINNMNHKRSSTIVNKEFLESYNNNNFKLNDEELVLCIHNISQSDVQLYAKLYNGNNKMDDYMKLRLLMDYFNCNKKYYSINKNLQSIGYGAEETNYWTNKYNCKLNMTKSFIDRGFELKISSATFSDEIKNAIDKLDTVDKDNYLQHIHRKKVYVDASSAVKKNGYRIYRMLSGEIDLTMDEVNEIFSNFNSERDRYDMFNMLLISKKYCHLVVNNPFVLDLMKPIMDKFMPLYKYLWGYAWLIFYLEECIKKTRTTVNDRYVFTLDTASKLPFFPYCSTDAHMNPYMSLLVSDTVLDYENNLQGLGMISGYSDYGISDLETFKKHLNIFSTNNEGVSIFEGLDWSNVAITGSTMTACIPKKSPLIDQFNGQSTEKDKYFRYFQEYYPTSDIDMMCNHASVFDFIDKANEVYECIKNNVSMLHGSGAEKNVKLVPHKTLTIIVSTKYVKENMPDYDLDEVVKNRHTNEIKEMFYYKYVSKKTEQNMIERKTKSNKMYKDHYHIVPIDDVNIIFTDHVIKTKNDNIIDGTEKGKNKYYVTGKKNKIDLIDVDSDEEVSKENEQDAFNMLTGKEEEEEIYFKLSENLKYKIKSQFLLHTIEFFQILFPDFFSCVSRFHLPCVRAFYDGTNAYLLPSAITAYMTGINMDYKYFAGTKDPIEIINKNRMRGYTTCINDPEKVHTIEYSRNVTRWQNLLKINVKNKHSIKSVFGPLNLNNPMFKPRRFNNDLYHNCFPVDDQYADNNKTYVNSVQDLENEYNTRFGYDVSQSGINLLKYKTINEQGYVNPIKKWVIDAAYDELA